MRVTADYLEATNASSVPFRWNLVSQCLGKREYLVCSKFWENSSDCKICKICKVHLLTLAYFAYSDRRSLCRSRMMFGVILREPRNMKNRPRRIFRLRITKPWPMIRSISFSPPHSEKVAGILNQGYQISFLLSLLLHTTWVFDVLLHSNFYRCSSLRSSQSHGGVLVVGSFFMRFFSVVQTDLVWSGCAAVG